MLVHTEYALPEQRTALAEAGEAVNITPVSASTATRTVKTRLKASVLFSLTTVSNLGGCSFGRTRLFNCEGTISTGCEDGLFDLLHTKGSIIYNIAKQYSKGDVDSE